MCGWWYWGFLFFKLNLAVMERKKARETQILLKAKRTRFPILKPAIIDQEKSVSWKETNCTNMHKRLL